ncbi:MAG: hypothetical protein PVH29_05975 [Candidatus Zixiibacteriota bacterium]|jgi:hypothetical protein
MAESEKTSPELRWRSWPLIEYPGRSALALATAAAATAAIYFLWHSPLLAAIGAVALLLSLHGHFLPRYYRLDDKGVNMSVVGLKKARDWDFFHSYYADRLGVMLSTFSYPSRLDSFRGVNLRFSGGNRDDVIAFVAAKLPRAEKPARRGRAE